MPYVFNRYYQGKEDNYLKQEGSGIGLALCKNIIELHHGEIIIDSEQHKGTICSIILNKSTTIPHKTIIRFETTLIHSYQLMQQNQTRTRNSSLKIQLIQIHKMVEVPLLYSLLEDNDELRKLLYNKLKYEFGIATAKKRTRRIGHLYRKVSSINCNRYKNANNKWYRNVCKNRRE